MKRLALKLFVFLLVGAIINVAVAWGCAIWSPVREFKRTQQAWVGESHATGFGREDILFDEVGSPLPVLERTGACANEKRVGWPFLCLAGSSEGTFDSLDWISVERRLSESPESWPRVFRWSWKSPKWLSHRDRYHIHFDPATGWNYFADPRDFFPIRPIPKALLKNTLFYALIIAMPFVPSAIRRLVGDRRIKRGLCVRCGYPVGVSGVCSECGTPTDNQKPTTENVSS